MKYTLEDFAKESDLIEGEAFNRQHLYALEAILKKPLTKENLLAAHFTFAPDEEWAGKYRDINVMIGGHMTPNPYMTKELMRNWFMDLDDMNSFEAHVRFEKIHPFQDGNGRIGRAIWLKIALEEGFQQNRTFLHEFYYQTLTHSK